MRKVFCVLALALLCAVPAFADGVTVTFAAHGLGDIGKVDTFSNDGLSLVVSGYSAPGTAADLWFKSGGGTGITGETGLGLASGVDHEVSGTGFVQINLGALKADGLTFTLDSLQSADAYDVFGSNTAGVLGTMLVSNDKAGGFFENDGFQFISVKSAGGDDSILLEAVTVATPEPSTFLLLSLGALVLLLLGGRRVTRETNVS